MDAAPNPGGLIGARALGVDQIQRHTRLDPPVLVQPLEVLLRQVERLGDVAPVEQYIRGVAHKPAVGIPARPLSGVRFLRAHRHGELELGKPLAKTPQNFAGASAPVGGDHLQAAADVAGAEVGELPLGAPVGEVEDLDVAIVVVDPGPEIGDEGAARRGQHGGNESAPPLRMHCPARLAAGLHAPLLGLPEHSHAAPAEPVVGVELPLPRPEVDGPLTDRLCRVPGRGVAVANGPVRVLDGFGPARKVVRLGFELGLGLGRGVAGTVLIARPAGRSQEGLW